MDINQALIVLKTELGDQVLKYPMMKEAMETIEEFVRDAKALEVESNNLSEAVMQRLAEDSEKQHA